jgi:cell division protein FtsZ
MGGGTGTGAAPVIARAARESGILTVGVVTKPFHFEGTHRMRVADQGISELQKFVDTLIIIPNQNLFRVANERTTFADAFKMADDVLYSGVRGVTDLMIMPGLINLDFADIRTVMSEMGKAMMGTGEAEGENRALDAAQKAISNPLLDDVSMKGAKGVLINITGGPDMTLFEVDEAANRIRDEVDPDANIIFGSTFDETLTGRMRVSVVATGIDAAAMAQPKPTVISLAANRPAAARPVVQSALRSEGTAALKAETVAVAQPIVATAAQPAMAEAASAVAQARTEPAFIAPRPAEPVQAAAPKMERTADPFAAADMANAAPRAEPVKEKRRGPSLFERVTGTGRARAQTAQPAPAAPAPAPTAQPRLGGLDPVDRAAQPAQDDLLDIPAFLRRQAN